MSKSFACQDVDAVNCPSTRQPNRSCQESAAQTNGTTFSEGGVQSKSLIPAEVQTDDTQDQIQSSCDMTKLAAWLNKITPRVLEELEKSHKSRAFDGYKTRDKVDHSIKHLYSLSLEQSHPQHNFKISAVEWSSTGGMLAVARSAREHSSWCDHPGYIFLHQTNREESKIALHQRVLDVSSCVTALSFHPRDSFILACGTFSGEIVVWNLQRDDAVIIGNMTVHSEAIVQLEWIQSSDVTNVRPVLASVSRDGSVILWTMKSITNTLKVSQCFLLQAEKENIDYGIMCAKFNPCTVHFFLAGVEGGSVVVCSTDSRRPCHQKRGSFSKELDCFDPVMHVLDGHKGTVNGVQWIPSSKDLFLSCGSDSEIHVYSLNEFELLKIIHLPGPACGLEIMSSHPNIAITWDQLGEIHLHDVHTMKILPNLGIENEHSKVPLSLVRVCSSSFHLFALGSFEGKVSVWQVPHMNFISSSE